MNEQVVLTVAQSSTVWTKTYAKWQTHGIRGIASSAGNLSSYAWSRFWMRYAGRSVWGRIATRLATWFVVPYKGTAYLADLNRQGFIAPSAVLSHPQLYFGVNVYIGEGVIIYQAHEDGGSVQLGDRVHLHRDIIIEVDAGGSLTVGHDTHIQPRCHFTAAKAPIRIGSDVQIAPYCAFYPYDHSFAPGELIRNQPLTTKGGILIEDDVWLGVGVIVLDGVRIGTGAVIGAGSVVTHDIPDGAIATGVPARVVKMRSDLREEAMGMSSPVR